MSISPGHLGQRHHLTPQHLQVFEVHVDCGFAGNWVKEDVTNDPSTAKFWTGHIISYAGCPIIWWASKLQTKVVLSTTKNKYINLSESPPIAIIHEISSRR
jgi:hypothetical protein